MRTCTFDFETASSFDDWANLSTPFSWYLLLRNSEVACLRLSKRISAARRAAEIVTWKQPTERDIQAGYNSPRPKMGMTP